MGNAEETIADFVRLLNRRGFGPEFCNEVPEYLRTEGPDAEGFCRWEIKAKPNNWADPVEAAFGQKLPKLFRALVNRYAFLEFELGPLTFFHNTGDTNRFGEFSVKVLEDEGLLEVLVPNGLVHFAHLTSGNYDPLCFDTKRRGAELDCPVVQVDHEEILCHNRLSIVEELAPSFRDLLEEQRSALRGQGKAG